jgi:hypothetical protein
MNKPFTVAVADGFSGQYRSKEAFMAALADCLNIELIRAGCRHARVAFVRWSEPGPGRPHPIASVQVEAGGSEGMITVERLRAAYAEQERMRRQGGDGQGRMR